MWIEFVGSLLCTERFFSGYSGFSLSSKPNICFDFALIYWFQFTVSPISTPALDKLPFLPFLSFKHFRMILTVSKMHALCVNSTRQHSISISWPQFKCVCYCSWWSNHNRHNSCSYSRAHATAVLVSQGTKTRLSGQNKNFLLKDCVIPWLLTVSMAFFRVTWGLLGLILISWKVWQGNVNHMDV